MKGPENEVTETKDLTSKPRVRRTPEERAAQLRAQAEAAEYRAKLSALRAHPVARELETAHAHLLDAQAAQSTPAQEGVADAIDAAIVATRDAIIALGFDVKLVTTPQ